VVPTTRLRQKGDRPTMDCHTARRRAFPHSNPGANRWPSLPARPTRSSLARTSRCCPSTVVEAANSTRAVTMSSWPGWHRSKQRGPIERGCPAVNRTPSRPDHSYPRVVLRAKQSWPAAVASGALESAPSSAPLSRATVTSLARSPGDSGRVCVPARERWCRRNPVRVTPKPRVTMAEGASFR
jgi:hypothetical protein